MARRLDSRSSVTAEMTCIVRAASTFGRKPWLRGDDAVALKILPPPINGLIRNGFYRYLHTHFGTPPAIYRFVVARTKFFDGLYADAVARGVPQLVNLGAGLDSRAIRFPAEAGTRVIELDSAFTQERKRELFSKAGVALPAQLNLQPIDFGAEQLEGVLARAGYDPKQPAFVMMEGVTMYVPQAGIEATFAALAKVLAPGSSFAFDYVTRKGGKAGDATGRRSVAGTGEAFLFGIEEGGLDGFLARFGLRAARHLDPAAIEGEFLADGSGRVRGRINPANRFCVAGKA